MYELIKLPYSYDALEPVMDQATVEIHHSKHHQNYVNNFNKALENYPELANLSPEEIVRDLNNLPVNEASRLAIRNHGGGVVNHNLFWQIMNPANNLNQSLNDDIIKDFGSIANMKQQFNELALKHFGYL